MVNLKSFLAKSAVRLISAVSAAAMCLALCSCEPKNSLRDPVELDRIMPVLLYTGIGFGNGTQACPEFTEADIRKMTEAGITDFILNTAVSPIYYRDIDEYGNEISESKLLCSKEDIDTLTMEDLGVDSEYELETKKEQIKSNITIQADDRDTINAQIDFEIELGKRILSVNPDARLWFSFPFIKIDDGAEFYAQHYMDVIYPKIKLAFSEEEFEKNVCGMYWATENASGTNWNSENLVDFDNPVVKAAKYCADIIHEDGKTFIWIPFTLNGKQTERSAIIANQTDIFDYVFFQPGYLWGDEKEPYLDIIQNSVTNGVFMNSNGTPYGGEKKSNTVIGVEIELDNKFITLSDGDEYLRRYNGYVEHFSQFKHDKSMAFYCSNRDNMMNPEVFELFKEWFN